MQIYFNNLKYNQHINYAVIIHFIALQFDTNNFVCLPVLQYNNNNNNIILCIALTEAQILPLTEVQSETQLAIK